MPTIHEIGTVAVISIDGEQVHVQVCGIDDRFGYRVTNKQWGGRVDTWVPATDLTSHN